MSVVALVAATVMSVPAAAVASEPPPAGARWQPEVGARWQIQFTGSLDTTVDAEIFDVDGFDTPAATVTQLHAQGRRAVCYISAGSWEKWRPDAAAFPTSVLGRSNGWPGERWLDIRRLDLLAPIMAARLDMCRAKGFDAVDPDNVDGYSNRTGFRLRYSDQLRYNRWLADAAHARGMSIALKNDVEQVADLVDWFDFAINEECVAYDECDTLRPFLAAGKAVLHVEYDLSTAYFCPRVPRGFSSMRKNLNLDAWREPCP